MLHGSWCKSWCVSYRNYISDRFEAQGASLAGTDDGVVRELLQFALRHAAPQRLRHDHSQTALVGSETARGEEISARRGQPGPLRWAGPGDQDMPPAARWPFPSEQPLEDCQHNTEVTSRSQHRQTHRLRVQIRTHPDPALPCTATSNRSWLAVVVGRQSRGWERVGGALDNQHQAAAKQSTLFLLTWLGPPLALCAGAAGAPHQLSRMVWASR